MKTAMKDRKVLQYLAETEFPRGHKVTLKAVENIGPMITISYVDGGEQDFLPEATSKEQEASIMEKLRLFAYNFPHDFIQRVWGEGTNTTEHLSQRIHGMRMKRGLDHIDAGVFFDWLCELDSANKAKLYEFISDHMEERSEPL